MKGGGCGECFKLHVSMRENWDIVQATSFHLGGLIRRWIDLFVVRGDRVSCSSSVGAEVKLQSWQSDDVAEGCGRCADTVSLFTVLSVALGAHWTLGATWLDPANPLRVRWALAKRLRHMRTRASLKIASVIQPGRRWDSPAKLTSPIFLHTFSENNGIVQVEGGSGGVSRYIRLFITCRRRWTRTHGKTAFERPIEKRGSLENNGRLCSV